MLVKSDAYRNYCLLTSQCELISQLLKAGNKIFYGFVWEMVLGVWKQRERVVPCFTREDSTLEPRRRRGV